MRRQPTKAQLLRAMNAIHARLEAVTHGGSSNVWETIGVITYWVEESLGKEVKRLRAGEEDLAKVHSGALRKVDSNAIKSL
jgi:hypothetical protein